MADAAALNGAPAGALVSLHVVTLLFKSKFTYIGCS